MLVLMNMQMMMEHAVLMIQLKALRSCCWVTSVWFLSKLSTVIRLHQIAEEVEEDENQEDSDSDTRTSIYKMYLDIDSSSR